MQGFSQAIDMFGSSMTMDRSTMHPKFDTGGVRPLVHDSTFHVIETSALTTRPSVTSQMCSN